MILNRLQKKLNKNKITNLNLQTKFFVGAPPKKYGPQKKKRTEENNWNRPKKVFDPLQTAKKNGGPPHQKKCWTPLNFFLTA